MRMPPDQLDNVDKGILYLLQQNARTNTTTDIGEKVGVSSSTVGNRINRLEERGVITGYHPTVDYDKTDLNHHLLVTGKAPFEDREAIADEVMDVTGVVCLRELVAGDANMTIEVVGYSREDVEQILTELNDLRVDIIRISMMKRERNQPYNHFGKQYTSEGDPGYFPVLLKTL